MGRAHPAKLQGRGNIFVGRHLAPISWPRGARGPPSDLVPGGTPALRDDPCTSGEMPYNYGNKLQARQRTVFHELAGFNSLGRGPDFSVCPGRLLRQVSRGFGKAALSHIVPEFSLPRTCAKIIEIAIYGAGNAPSKKPFQSRFLFQDLWLIGRNHGMRPMKGSRQVS